jgi:glycosyltransferase involved in cell wall biosynthesis
MDSVQIQSWFEVEHVIVDGMSDDSTPRLIGEKADGRTKVIRERDSGLYDAINKGIRHATGEVVGLLNADDVYAHRDVVKDIAQAFLSQGVECIHGGVRYTDATGKTKRVWDPEPYRPGLFQKSWTPAHPAFYTYRCNYERYGLYRNDYRIAADVELMYRFLEVQGLSSYHIPEELVVMSSGGISNRGLGSTLTIYREVRRAIRENGGRFNDVVYLFHKLLKAKRQLSRRE